jgi:hypothetical protein
MISKSIRLMPLFLLGGAFLTGAGWRLVRGRWKRAASTLLGIALTLVTLAVIVSIATAWASATIETSP